MSVSQNTEKEISRLSGFASQTFLGVETVAYAVLGAMLALTALLGGFRAGASLLDAALQEGDASSLVVAIDRLLFVLMVVEILHTVRVSFREGTLVCEPFLVVGLIASIRRVLVITLETSQANEAAKWTPDHQLLLAATMRELTVLGGLILVMVVSIYLLRHSRRAFPLPRPGKNRAALEEE
jgi:uncharacterized membrane protein (DUF373 family)